MAPTKVVDPTHRALRPIKHDNVDYAVGDPIHLTDEQAENLGKEIVEPFIVPVSKKDAQ